MTRVVAVASSSVPAADAARDVIGAGGNAVDAAVAAAFASINSEPGVCALAGGAFITVWSPGSAPQCIDGYVSVPGLAGGHAGAQSATDVTLAYGGGVTTTIGPASIAVPGTPAALELLHTRFGRLPWHECLAPAITLCRDGFPLPAACHHYLTYSGTSIFGRSPEGFAALHSDDGALRAAGSPIVVPGLADSLELIAREGSATLYRGALADVLVRHVQAGGGILSREDLAAYQPTVHPARQIGVGDWTLAMPPPPSIGGSMLAAILESMAAGRPALGSMHACLAYRRRRLDFADDLTQAAQSLLDASRDGTLPTRASAATVHTSASDSDGLACAITASAGYGCGEIPAGTGLWLNNCLGELELNRRGLDAGPPGARLPTNMAPVAARHRDEILAIGSPGADRITSAMVQVIHHFAADDRSLVDAISAPRWHVEMALERDNDDEWSARVHAEPDALCDVDTLNLPVRAVEHPSMYFGGVGATRCVVGTGNAEAVADPRRDGGTLISVVG